MEIVLEWILMETVWFTIKYKFNLKRFWINSEPFWITNDFVGAKKAKEYLLPHSKGKIENSSPKSVPNQATKKPVENKVNQKTNNTQQAQKQEAKNNFEELLARNNNNVKQMANNLKAGHFDKLNINKKELAKKLIEELKKDLSTWDSIGAKNIERRKFLEDLIKG